MQKRKKVFGREGRRVILFVLLFVFIIGISPAVIAGIPVWIKARNGAVHPDIVPNLNWIRANGNYFGLISSVSNPYSINGITDSFLKIGFRNSNNNLWVSWSLLHYDLYREDRVKIQWIREIARSGLSLGISPAFGGRKVTGFEYETDGTVKTSISFDWKKIFTSGFEGIIYDPDFSADEVAKFMFSINDFPLSLLVNYSVLRRNENEFLMGAEANLSSDFCLLSGYGFNTNEISSGLVYQRNNWYFGFSWNHHPVLGSTLSAGIGVLWIR
ncbi:hypothetical protein J7M07_06230 [bacterium]|nr:hypothetical protein [bacterium]